MVFPFDAISDRFSSFMNTWFDSADMLKPVFDLYFGTRYNPAIYVENQFLSYMIAIEAFHRLDTGGQYLSREKYEKIRQKLVVAIPNDMDKSHKESLKKKIEYGYEFSMRRRLKDVCRKYEKNIGKFIDNANQFNDCVVGTRNHLIHNDPATKGRVCTGKDLVILTYQLKLLLEICLLRKLGFSEGEINNLIARQERFQLEYIKSRLVLHPI